MRMAKLVCASALILLAGCIPALKDPPSLEELAGGSEELSPEDVEQHRDRAESRFATRRVPAVREAVLLWTQVAQAETDDLDALILALEARVWLAEHEPKSGARESESTAAVHTGQWCQRRAPQDVRCTYWLGVALGVQARERRRTALDALPRILELFTQAAGADPTLDDAGPERALAYLYLRAPGWPTGPGDPDLGLEHALKAVELRPGYPPNQLVLGEALLAVAKLDDARRAYQRALELAEQIDKRDAPDAGEWARKARKGVNSVNRSGARI